MCGRKTGRLGRTLGSEEIMVSRDIVTGSDVRMAEEREREQEREEANARQACAIPKRPASSFPAANGKVCASREDGGDPCSVRGTRSHAMLAMLALCRLAGCVIESLEKNSHLKTQIACFTARSKSFGL